MKHPTVRFQVNPREDIHALEGFVSDAHYDDGAALEDAVFSVVPAFRKYFKNNRTKLKARAEISRYIEAYYKENSSRVKTDMQAYAKAWKKIAPKYFALVKEIFGNAPWPKGKYTAYPTMWRMFPRNLKDKTFQVPVLFRRNKLVPVIVAHELLHFMFYSYLFKVLPELSKERNELLAWNISELFNSVVQTTPRWKKAFGMVPRDYDYHTKVLRALRKKYTEVDSDNRDQLIEELVMRAKNLNGG